MSTFSPTQLRRHLERDYDPWPQHHGRVSSFAFSLFLHKETAEKTDNHIHPRGEGTFDDFMEALGDVSWFVLCLSDLVHD